MEREQSSELAAEKGGERRGFFFYSSFETEEAPWRGRKRVGASIRNQKGQKLSSILIINYQIERRSPVNIIFTFQNLDLVYHYRRQELSQLLTQIFSNLEKEFLKCFCSLKTVSKNYKTSGTYIGGFVSKFREFVWM